MLPWIGGLLVLVTVYGIIKRWETRLVLFSTGFAMTIFALKPMETFKAFEKSMTNAGLITAILSVMGFAFVMKLTKADQHLVNLVAGAVTKFRFVLIPLSVIATFLVNIALPSASGTAAAVGAVLIPVMIAAGVHPAAAAAAVMAGTFGGNLNPGSAHVVMVAKMAKLTEMQTIGAQATVTIACGILGAIVLTALTFMRKEASGHQGAATKQAEGFKVNLLLAIVPVIPLVLLILGSKYTNWGMTVPAAMLIGTFVALAISRTSPAEVTKAFFDGMGKAYADIMGIIIAAGVFTAGLTATGLIEALLKGMTGVKGAIGAAGTWGPMLIATLSGSGDAATIAFNNAVTPHAAQFGMTIVKLGSLAQLAGSLGRTMSPVAGACIIVAGIAGVSPMEVAKRNMPGMILASIVAFVMLGM